MIRVRLVVLLAALLSAGAASACINETGTTLAGRHVGVDFGPEMAAMMFTHRRPHDVADYTPGVIERARERRDFDSLNDLAATAIRLGRPQAAVKLLESLERRWPGRYETATNLGTAFELLGRNADALEWIREGIVRNPRSHYGTEWLHVRILEAKLAAGGRLLSPDDSLLGLDFGGQVAPMRPTTLPAGNDGEPVDFWGLAQGLRTQLMERTALVAPPDPVVASLMLDLANLEMAIGSVETAEVVYGLALDNGATATSLIAQRRKAIATAAKRGAMVHPDDRQLGTCEICYPPEEEDEAE